MSFVQRVRARPDHPVRRAVRLVRRTRSPRALLLRAAFRPLNGPLSDWYGFDRGTPIDRLYIEAFLTQHAADVHGCVLEVKDDTYTRRFGGSRLTRIEVVDIDASNPRATIVADLSAPGGLPRSAYDCILLTQTLQYLNPTIALPLLYEALLPGGVLLLTISVLAMQETSDTDRWRLPPAGLLDLMRTHLPADAEVEVTARGNAVAASAFLLGMVVEELTARRLAAVDWRFPVVTVARVRRPA